MLILNLVYFLGFSFLLSLLLPNNDVSSQRLFGSIVFGLSFIYSILLIYLTNTQTYELVCFDNILSQNFVYTIGIDGISSVFILLTNFLFLLCVISSWSSVMIHYKAFIILMLVLDFVLINLFCALDLFYFYVWFESVLFPMFILIGIWGSRQRRIHAALQFFFYTMIGSFFMLLSVALMYQDTGTTNIILLNMYKITEERQLFVWLCFFMAFAIKIPMFPFHIWLPEAHVEAPTIGSVILAGILLKLGGYGMLRFMLPLLPTATFFYTPLLMTTSALAVVYTSITAIRQIDLKKIIAYASVSHMNLVVLGIFNYTIYGIIGSIFLMLGHGIVSGGLFFSVGVLYERYHTRMLKYYGGLVYAMPLFATLFFILILANFSFPGTSNFIGEFLILAGLVAQNLFCTLFSLISIIFSVIYSIWLYNRCFFGFVNTKALLYFSDLNKREFVILALCCIITIFFGLCPNLILQKLEWSVWYLTWQRIA